MKHLNLKRKASQGFSLVEMLVVIAVIGVIAAIAIPSIGSINAFARTAVAERNAQSVMSVYQCGLAAGANWGPITLNTGLVTAVVKGAHGSGAFSTTNFQVPGMSAADQTNCAAHISKDASTGAWSYSGP